MKILENAYKPAPPEWPKTIWCNSCDSRLLIDKKDVKPGFLFYPAVIKCPCCGQVSTFLADKFAKAQFYQDLPEAPVDTSEKTFQVPGQTAYPLPKAPLSGPIGQNGPPGNPTPFPHELPKP